MRRLGPGAFTFRARLGAGDSLGSAADADLAGEPSFDVAAALAALFADEYRLPLLPPETGLRLVVIYGAIILSFLGGIRWGTAIGPYGTGRQAPEFAAEPRLAHDGGADGLRVIRELVRQATDRLVSEGLLVIEVGGLRRAVEREFAALAPEWLPTADGSNCVVLFRAQRLRYGGARPGDGNS